MLGPRMQQTGIVPNPPASSQDKKPLWAPDLLLPSVETVGFYLMLIEQAEDALFVRECRIGLMFPFSGLSPNDSRFTLMGSIIFRSL